jgi:thioredoxin-like negative regulator of GroEL
MRTKHKATVEPSTGVQGEITDSSSKESEVKEALDKLSAEDKADVEAALNPIEIVDPASVFKLALLQERISNTNTERLYKRLLYEIKLRDLKNEAKTVDSQLDLQALQGQRDVVSLQKEVEAKYGIKLSEYGYDDVTGKLTKLPPSAVTQSR